jgi:hypothetical protein
MKALLNFTKGFRQSASLPKMILALYALNLLLSLLLAVPLFHSLDDSFGSSLVGERMAQGFDYLWWEEFRDRSRGLAGTFTPALTGKGGPLLNLESLLRGGFLGLPPLLLAVGFLYLILRSLLSGGVLYIYSAEKERFFLKDLLKETVTYAVRFLGILLLGWMFLIGCVVPLSGWLGSLVERTAEHAVSEITPFFLNLLVSGVLLFVNVLRAVLQGFRFVFRHPGATLSLFGLLFLIQACVTVGYILLRSLIPQTGSLGVFSAFLLLQLFVFALVWIRCWLYSSQMYLFRFLQ